MARKRYRLLTEGRTGLPVGTLVYDFVGYDYGLANDDTRVTGIEHITVTTCSEGDPDWAAGGFTHALRDLEEC